MILSIDNPSTFILNKAGVLILFIALLAADLDEKILIEFVPPNSLGVAPEVSMVPFNLPGTVM